MTDSTYPPDLPEHLRAAWDSLSDEWQTDRRLPLHSSLYDALCRGGVAESKRDFVEVGNTKTARVRYRRAPQPQP